MAAAVKRGGLRGRCMAVAKQQKTRFYILGRCIAMLLCWHAHDLSDWAPYHHSRRRGGTTHWTHFAAVGEGERAVQSMCVGCPAKEIDVGADEVGEGGESCYRRDCRMAPYFIATLVITNERWRKIANLYICVPSITEYVTFHLISFFFPSKKYSKTMV